MEWKPENLKDYIIEYAFPGCQKIICKKLDKKVDPEVLHYLYTDPGV